MNPPSKRDYLIRSSLLDLLSDAEVAKVSTAENEDDLGYGEEYIDLEALGGGVHKAYGQTPPVGRLLPRKAVHEDTWVKILAHLAAPKTAVPTARA